MKFPVLVLVLSVAVTGLVLAMAWDAGVQTTITGQHVKMDKAEFAAESGTQLIIWYVKNGKMAAISSPMTGTVNAAQAGGFKDVGTLAPGMAADVIAMAKSPLENIHAVMDVGFVMRGGIVAKVAAAAN